MATMKWKTRKTGWVVHPAGPTAPVFHGVYPRCSLCYRRLTDTNRSGGQRHCNICFPDTTAILNHKENTR